MKETYAGAGVDIDLGDTVAGLIGRHARTTLGPEVLGGVGFFGGLYEFRGYRNPVLVSSVDSVGTKLKIANALGRHDTIGMDIVNHCVNDVFVCGAEPLFFLDYLGMGRLEADKAEAIARGLAHACREAGCALIGGETAELPGIYHGDDYDLVGFVMGAVEKDALIRGERIAAGDGVIGLPSSGLHTNGYSLVRRVLGETPRELEVHYAELGRTLGEELLEPHRCYRDQLKRLLPHIKGMAHITGGGLPGNIPRVLPRGLMARLDTGTWTVPPIFRLIQDRGTVAREEMFRVFNMGIGMVAICSAEDAGAVTGAVSGAVLIGQIAEQDGDARVIL